AVGARPRSSRSSGGHKRLGAETRASPDRCSRKLVNDLVLLADRFTYIHEPKTGGTFVTYVLTQLHGGLADLRPLRHFPAVLRHKLPTGSFSVERLGARVPLERGVSGTYGRLYRWNDHGSCSEIPR